MIDTISKTIISSKPLGHRVVGRPILQNSSTPALTMLKANINVVTNNPGGKIIASTVHKQNPMICKMALGMTQADLF